MHHERPVLGVERGKGREPGGGKKKKLEKSKGPKGRSVLEVPWVTFKGAWPVRVGFNDTQYHEKGVAGRVNENSV